MTGSIVGAITTSIRNSKRMLGVAAVAVTVSLLLGGCVPGAEVLNAPKGDRGLYLGPLPQPIALASSPVRPGAGLPPIPMPPSDLSDQAAMDAYQKEIEVYLKALEESGIDLETGNGVEVPAGALEYGQEFEKLVALTAGGGEKAVAAWQTLYVTAGIAVTGANGKPVEVQGRTGAGYPVSDAELRLWAVPSPGVGISLTELAEIVAGLYEVGEGKLLTPLYDSLVGALDMDFSMAFNTFQPQMFSGAWGLRPVEEVLLTLDQVNLVLRRLSAEIETRFLGTHSPGAAVAPGASDRALAVPAGGIGLARAEGGAKPCDVSNPWVKAFLKGSNLSFENFVFGPVMDILEVTPGFANWTSKFKGGMGAGAAALAVLAVILKAKALRAEMSLSDAPLVRTKTNRPGEVRDLKVKMSFDKELWEDMRRCMSLFMGGVGIDGGPGDGTGEGLKLDIHSLESGRMRVGDGTGASTTAVNQATTNGNGEATFKLSGAPYAEKIPDTATPEELTVGVRVDSNLQESDFWNDMQTLAGDAAAGGLGALLGGVLQTIQRMKLLSFSTDVPFRDWYLDAEFDVTLEGRVNGRNAANLIYDVMAGCGGGELVSSSTADATGSVVTENAVRVYAKLVSDPDSYYADQVVLFAEPGTGEFPWMIGENGVKQFPMLGDFRVDKRYSDPGIAPLPTPLRAGPLGCGDGSGEQAPPKSDCGVRDFVGDLEVSVLGRKLVVTGKSLDRRPWSHCGGAMAPRDGLIPPDVAGCTAMERKGGRLPAINDVFDADMPKLEVSGSIVCGEHKPGSLVSYRFEWTLVFCRIVEGKPAC